ncbi:MAG: ATP-dependent DNA helicase [Candidatus Ozemobacteraceae bacterium]
MSLATDFAGLNDQQKAVVTKFHGPSLITAGPGTGKTRTIAVLIGKILESGLRFKNLLALTFSDKAAGELRERVFSYYPHSFDECWISTFHSFCARLLREQFHQVGIRPDFRLLTSFKEAVLLDGICGRLDPASFPFFGRVLRHRGFQLETLTFISLLKSNLVDTTDLDAFLADEKTFDERSRSRFQELSILFHAYERERTRLGYLDFRDLISLSIRVLRDPATAASYREKFKVILVDEFQDTDPAQFFLLTLLTGDPGGSSNTKGGKMRVAVIGDPRQSIYRFRGADPRMMDPNGPFRKRYRAKVFPLSKNYRSAPVILEAAANLRWTQQTKPPEQHPPEIVSAASLSSSPSKRLGFIERYDARDELSEARLLARRIASLIIYGVANPTDPQPRRYRPDQIAVLVRNNYQVDLLSESLRALNIPFSIGGDMKFFRSEEVGTLVSLLKAVTLNDLDADDALRRAFRSPFFGIDPLWTQSVITGLGQAGRLLTFLEPFTKGTVSEANPQSSKDETYLPGVAPGGCASTESAREGTRFPGASALNLPEAAPEILERVSAFASTISLLRDEEDAPLEVVAARLLLIARDWIRDATSPVTRNVLHFRAFLADYEDVFRRLHGRSAKLPDLMADFDAWLTYYASTLEEGGETVGGGEGVRLMTVHQSKGLEFPVVIVPGLCENQFPVALRENLLIGGKGLEALQKACENREIPFFNPYPSGRADHLEEERRLFFVAVTRAQEGLIMSRPLRLSGEPSLPAPFLEEIGVRPAPSDADERRVLSLGELRVKLAGLAPEIRIGLRDELASLEQKLGAKHLIVPRSFEKPAIDAVRIPNSFSFSAAAIKDYLDCPRRFFFKRLLRLPDAPEQDNLHLLRGLAQHAVFEELHRPGSVWEQGKRPTIEEIETLWREKGEPRLAGVGKLRKLTVGHAAREAFSGYIHAIYELGQLPGTRTIGVEHPFAFAFRGFRCQGRFDRMTRGPDGIWVIDYKTGGAISVDSMMKKVFPEDGGFPEEIQLPFYLLAIRETRNEPCCAMTFYVNQPAYQKKYKGFVSGYLKGAALNFGAGPAWGADINATAFDIFCDRLETVMTSIRQDATFPCRPSERKGATTCLQGVGQTRCEFVPFCQEHIEASKHRIRGEDVEEAGL